MTDLSRRAFLGVASLAALGSGGCITEGYYRTRPTTLGLPTAAPHALVPVHPSPPRALPMFDGHGGATLTWVDLMRGVQWSHVTILGETHDDAVAHAVQLAIVEDALVADPRTAISLEMLDRSHQPDLDLHLTGAITVEEFVERTGVANWAGAGSWMKWYQPVIDAARRVGAPVIAANAPRAYVRMARLEGYAALRALPRDERRLFDLPHRLDEGDYRRRFEELMTRMHAQSDPPREPDPENVEATFRSQMTWDATMAASMARAIGIGRAPRVIHLVGQFHSDFRGGVVSQVRARAPWARIFTVSLQPARERALRDADLGRADAVIFTGFDG